MRNYRNEYDNYQGNPRSIKDRAKRNKARSLLAKEGKVHKGDGMDVNHKTPLSHGGLNKRSNLEVTSQHKNRSFKRNSNGSMLK